MKNLGKFKHIVVVGILIVLCQPVFAGRAPANYFPSDDFEVAPAQYKTKIEQIWIRFTQDDDEEGILNDMKNTFRGWEEREKFAKDWGLRGIEVTKKEKSKYLAKYYFKYLERRLSEEARKSKAGSTVRKLAKAKKALNPKIRINFSEDVRIRFKGRPLQGYGMIYLQNPWVDLKVQAEISGQAYVETSKHIEALGIDSKINYDILGKTILAEIQREIIPDMEAKITYENFLKDRQDDLQIQIKYSLPF